MSMPTEQTMRDAVARRDPAYDGVFYYGVITTGVFCKPSCSSKQARSDNMRFYADVASVAEAGFRPCMRCHPVGNSPELRRLEDIARYIEANFQERLGLKQLSEKAGLSVSRFQRVFKAAFGISPKAYQDAIRHRHFKDALRDGEQVTAAIYAAGYGSLSRVYGEKTRDIGMTPSAYRQGGKGETISWACRETVLGPMLMAATDRGVCFAQFGDNEASLLTQLRQEFPQAQLSRSDAQQSPQLDAWLVALDAHMNSGTPRPELPLDMRGTAFQMLVWRFLLSIPEGKVLSYTELAEGIGKPRAFRAVASACGANRIGVLVPCHRVLRGDGGLGGYRWGLERKRALLDAERAHKAEQN